MRGVTVVDCRRFRIEKKSRITKSNESRKSKQKIYVHCAQLYSLSLCSTIFPRETLSYHFHAHERVTFCSLSFDFRTKDGLEVPQLGDDVSVAPSDGDYHKKIKYGNRVQVSGSIYWNESEYPNM